MFVLLNTFYKHYLVCFGLALFVVANTKAFATDDPVLDGLPNHCHFSSQIEQIKQLATLAIPLISTGEIYFNCKFGLIWKTVAPVQETLIFTNKSYQFKQNGMNSLERLNTQQSSFLSKTLLGIMSADKDYIQDTFAIESEQEQAIQLTPKSDFIKKAITKITVQSDAEQSDQQTLIINIFQSDKTQLTIRAFASSIFEDSDADLQYCIENGFSKLACTALYKTQLAANTLVKTVR